jgi:hypothetical protein
MNLKQFKEYLRICNPLALRLLRSGDIKTTKVQHGTKQYWDIDAVSLEEYLDSKTDFDYKTLEFGSLRDNLVKEKIEIKFE